MQNTSLPKDFRPLYRPFRPLRYQGRYRPNKEVCALDLSFSRFEHDAPLTVLPTDLAVMMVGVAARQAASPTALSQSRLRARPAATVFAPVSGAFNAPLAASLRRWSADVNPVFTEPL